jgi:hypothetical protein
VAEDEIVLGQDRLLRRPGRPEEFSIVLTARPLSGQPTPSSESSEVRWGSPSVLRSYTMDWLMRIRINDFLSRNESPVIT